MFRQRVVLYGGIGRGVAARSTTWEYDEVNWTQIPVSGPGPRAGASMCFHVGLGKIVLFGGVDPFIGGLPGTWVYGCSVNVSWDVGLLLIVTTDGPASWTANLPALPQLLGVELFAQGISVDFAANPGGLVFSNGGGAMIGR